MLRNSSVVTFFLTISASLSAAAAVPTANIRMVAAVGQSAPGTTHNFGTFVGSPPSVNIKGDVAFRAAYANQGPEGIWAERGASGLQVVAVNGQAAPGIPGKTFEYFGPSNPGVNAEVGSLIFNNNGQVLFRATLAGSTSVFNNDGLWLADPVTGTKFIAKSGGTLPGSSRQVVQIEYSRSALNDEGDVTFRGRMTTSGSTDAGVWTYRGPGTTHLVAEAITPSYSSVAFSGAVLDGQGRPYFTASSGRTGVYGETSAGAVQLIAQDGQTAPGISPASTFDGVYDFDMAVNSSGTVAFASSLSNGKNALFTGSLSGPVTAKIVSGSPAPGAPAGSLFSSFYSPEINAQGRLAFKAEISGAGITSGNNTGIWLENAGGGFDLVALEGTTIPGGNGSIVFGSTSPDVFPEIVVNKLGQVAFLASTRPAGSSSASGSGIWATDTNGALHQVVWSGQPFDTVANGTKSHTLFDFAGNTGNDEGLPSGFSDSGYVTFRGTAGAFAEAIYVSSVVAVPEPNSAVLIAIMIGAIASRRSRSVRAYALSTRFGR